MLTQDTNPTQGCFHLEKCLAKNIYRILSLQQSPTGHGAVGLRKYGTSFYPYFDVGVAKKHKVHLNFERLSRSQEHYASLLKPSEFL